MKALRPRCYVSLRDGSPSVGLQVVVGGLARADFALILSSIYQPIGGGAERPPYSDFYCQYELSSSETLLIDLCLL